MIWHNINQNTPEWMDLRRGKFTASLFSDLFMKENTQTYQNAVYKIAFERLTGTTPDSYSNEWMQRGHDLEAEARQVYELDTFNKVSNGGFFELDDWVGASPDGLVDEDGTVEIKCPKYSTMIGYLLDKTLPKIYEWQVQGQLFVAQRQWCDFVAYHPNLKPLIIRVNRDEKKISELAIKLNESIEKAQEIINKLKEVA